MRVLFLCTENAGRSQLAEHLFAASAQGEHQARSAGTRPADRVNPAVVEILGRRGIDASRARPRPITDELVDWADRVITMGCGDECPVTGKPTEDWDLPDPKGRPVEEVERIAAQVADRVARLLENLGRAGRIGADRDDHVGGPAGLG